MLPTISEEKQWGCHVYMILFVLMVFFLLFILPAINRGENRQDSRRETRRSVCKKKLSDLYKLLSIYQEVTLDEGGGGGRLPPAGDDPGVYFQRLVASGFLKDPAQLICAFQIGPIASYKRDHQEGEPPFDLTGNKRFVHYCSPRGLWAIDGQGPPRPLSGDRWDHEVSLRNPATSESRRHRLDRNILMSTGKIMTVRSGDPAMDEYRRHLAGFETRDLPVAPERDGKVPVGLWFLGVYLLVGVILMFVGMVKKDR